MLLDRLRAVAKVAWRHHTVIRELPTVAVDPTLTVWGILSQRYGFTRSVVAGRCLSAEGQPIPWYTYPAIEALSAYDFRECDVFEYGAGASTLWWSQRGKSVTSVEHNPAWVAEIRPTLPATCRLLLEEQRRPYINAIDRLFDVIVIDGQAADGMRYDCALRSRPFLRDGGLIIVDNSDWLPMTCAYLRESGLFQVDYNGFVPISEHTSRTSLFLSQPCTIPYRQQIEPPIGGHVDDWETHCVTPGNPANSAPLRSVLTHA